MLKNIRRLLKALGHWLAEPQLGQRVVLVTDITLPGKETIHRGTTGLITGKSWPRDPAGSIGEVLLEQPHTELTAFGNRLQVWPHGTSHSPVTWSCFRVTTKP